MRRIAELRAGRGGDRPRDRRRTCARSGCATAGRCSRSRVSDPSGALELVFFNPPPWRQKQFQQGDSLLAWGKVTEGFGRRRQMAQPEVEKVQAGDSASFGRIVPVYPGPADYQHPALRKLMKRLVDELAPLVAGRPAAGGPRAPRACSRAPGRSARRTSRRPAPTSPRAAARATARLPAARLRGAVLPPARARAAPPRGPRPEPGIAFDASPAAVARGAVARAPVRAHAARRSGRSARSPRDMARPEPMNRLLQGDVGSGKTAVAFAAMMLAVQSGLAGRAHGRRPRSWPSSTPATLAGWLAGSGVEVALVGAAARGKAQRAARAAVADGRARIAVGTHALLEEDVAFERLGLVVVDEQHRFGVMQRLALIAKGRRPDVLVLTATPIPRTLALAFYGDLDQSKIDELPPGRTPVATKLYGDSQRKAAYDVARRELEAGRQVYVVYPLVEESEKTDLADATTGAAAAREGLRGPRGRAPARPDEGGGEAGGDGALPRRASCACSSRPPSSRSASTCRTPP